MDSFDLELQSLGLEKIYLHDCGLASAGSLGDYTKLTEVDLGGNNGSETGDNSGASDVPDADATIQGNKIPGWGN